MLAVESYNAAHSNEYLPLFYRYITRSINAFYARIAPQLLDGAAPDSAPDSVPTELANERREQAWHLLDYGLKVTHSWEVVRKLLLALAPAMERDGFRHEWLPFLERGIAVSQQAQDRSGEAQLSLYAGRLYRLRGEYPRALDLFEKSAVIYGDLRENTGRARALNELAYVARLQNNHDVAQTLVDEALGLLDADSPERAMSHWVLGTMASAQLKWEESAAHHRTALAIWQAGGDQQRAAWSLQNLGNALRGAGRYAEAAEHIQQAIVLLGQLRDPVNQAIARMNRGVVHIYNQDPAQALALFELAEPLFRQVGDQLHLAMVYTNMTIVQRDLRYWSAAEQSAHRAIRFIEALDDLPMLANIYDELGVTYMAQQRYAEAIVTFETGLERLAYAAPAPFQQMVNDSLASHLAEARALLDDAAQA